MTKFKAKPKAPTNLQLLPDEALREILKLMEAKKKLEVREQAQHSFLPFVHHVYDGFIEGRHHRVIAEKLEAVARGECKRLIINMPPRHSKSEFASYLMPAWFLGRNPKLKVIQATHNTSLAERFGRKVRDLIADPIYGEIFPDTMLKEDSKAAGQWATSVGGEYFAAGVGAAVTGRGADLFIIDDPHSEQDALSETAFDNAYEWYTSGPRQRLQPGASIILVMCMTGDTPVLLPDGREKALKDIRPGDVVATYEKGVLSTARVTNHQSNGVDSVFTIRTQSGRLIRANKRHPFLVDFAGEEKWVRLEDLAPGMSLVATTVAHGLQGPKSDRGSVPPVKPESPTTGKTPEQKGFLLGVMEDGAGCAAQRTLVTSKPLPEVFVRGATRRRIPSRSARKTLGGIAFGIGMASLLSSMTRWLSSRAVFARFVESLPRPKTLGHTGAESSASTTAIEQGPFEGCSATTATLPSDTEAPQTTSSGPLSIYDITTDRIVEIYPSGEEEVFDVEIERTENFIAHGVVSHNTRWGKKDLTGRLLANQMADVMADQWEVVEFPALMPSGEPLWPEFWSKDALLSIKGSLPAPKWEAQWQQKPTASGSTVIRREWWRTWDKEKIPPLKYIMQAYDTAFSKKESADYSAITTWGVFEPEEGGKDAIILLDAQRGRWNFPELKEIAFEEHAYWEPDMVIIEAKASGIPLIDELQARGIPALSFSPGRRTKGRGGVDKALRMHLVSPLFEAGLVWAPQDKRFAEEVIEEVCSFPNGDHDDYADSMTLALLRFRQGGFVRIHDEEEEDLRESLPSKKREYY